MTLTRELKSQQSAIHRLPLLETKKDEHTTTKRARSYTYLDERKGSLALTVGAVSGGALLLTEADLTWPLPMADVTPVAAPAPLALSGFGSELHAVSKRNVVTLICF